MKTITWKNIVLSVILTIIMVLFMLPLSVFSATGVVDVAEVTVVGGDGATQTPVVPEDPNVAEVNGTKYTSLADAIAAANGADIKLLQYFGENVVVEEGTTASIILGNGEGNAEGEPSGYYWAGEFTAENYSPVPLTMEGGSVTLKGGALSQGHSGTGGNSAISLKGGTLTIAGDVTKIIGAVRTDYQTPAIDATGGKLVLNGNVILDGGLEMSGTATVGDGLKCGIFTNSTDAARVSVEGHDTYKSVFELLAPGYVFAKYENGKAGDIVGGGEYELTEDVIVIACTHKDSSGNSLFMYGECAECGFTCTQHTLDDNGTCETCGEKFAAKDDKGNYYALLNDALWNVATGGTVTVLADLSEDVSFNREGKEVTLNLDGHSLTVDYGFATLTVSDGRLTVINGAAGSAAADEPIRIYNVNNNYAISANDGELILGSKLEANAPVYVYRSKITFEKAATFNAGLEFGLKCNGSTLPIGSIVKNSGDDSRIYVCDGTVFDLLPEDCVFAEYKSDGSTGDIIKKDTTTQDLYVDVIVVAHPTHTYAWNTTTHELACACGDVKETDTTAPGVDGIENGKTYYGEVTFTAADKNLDTVTVDGVSVKLTDGKYTIIADNGQHTIVAADKAGNSTTVTFTVNKIYTVTLVSGIGYTITGNPTVDYGQEYEFTVTIAAGYSRTEDYRILVNGTEVSAGSGDETHDLRTCTADGDMTITVVGVADITAPEEVEIKIGKNSFKSFLNSLTFDLFFKGTQTVTVTANDKGSGVKTVEYMLSATPFDKAEDITGEWKTVTFANGTASFSIAPNVKGFVYVRVTDADGNAAVINSAGMVIYTDSKADIKVAYFDRLSDEEITFNLTLNGNTVKSLTCDGTVIDSKNYTVADGTVTLRNAFLRTLAAGQHFITVDYNPLGETYAAADGNAAPTSSEITLQVRRLVPHLNFSAPNATYDGTVYDGPSITGQPTGTVIKYKIKGAADDTYTTTAPKNAGSYTVQITTPQDENYYEWSFTADFDITPKEVTITGTTAKSTKVYDGSTAAEIESNGTLSGVLDGDKLSIVKGKADYDDKNVGTGKTVTFSAFGLDGEDKGNYVLKVQPASVEADITPKELTVKDLKIKTKQYDGTDKAEFDGVPALNGVEDGDNLTLENGTPVFDSTAVGKNITIRFITPFDLSGDEVTVKNYTLTQPSDIITADIIAWLATGSEYAVNSNDWINTDFAVTAKDGYQLSLTNTANGTWTDKLTAANETADGKLTFYVKNTATGAISSAIIENYKIDKTAPAGTITINESNSFQEFLNTITFAMIYKDDVTVRLNADDDASDIKSVAYYKSDKALTLEQVKAVTDWAQYNSFCITASDKAQFVVYARIEDNAGNVTYLSSDGVEFDLAAPEIIGAENNGVYYVTRRVTIDDLHLKSVTLNGEPVDIDTPFDLIGDKDATYTIVAIDQMGNKAEFTISMKPISAITDAIKDFTTENVKSDDAERIETIAKQILDIADESDKEVIGEEQWNKLLEASENCEKLETRIAEVAAEMTRLTDRINAYDNVTSSDKADIEGSIAGMTTLLGSNNLTDTERTLLTDLKKNAQSLLDLIAAAKATAESDEILAIEKIAKDNVTLDDKDALEKAEKAIEDAQKDFGDNYTEEERESLKVKLDTVKAALDAIGNAEKAAEEIEKLPSADKVKLTDKDEVERVKKLVDALTENEKAMLGEEAVDKVAALNEKVAKLATGNTVKIVLLIALPLIFGGVITGVVLVCKKKKQQDR